MSSVLAESCLAFHLLSTILSWFNAYSLKKKCFSSLLTLKGSCVNIFLFADQPIKIVCVSEVAPPAGFRQIQSKTFFVHDFDSRSIWDSRSLVSTDTLELKKRKLNRRSSPDRFPSFFSFVKRASFLTFLSSEFLLSRPPGNSRLKKKQICSDLKKVVF